MLSRGIEPGQILISNKSIWHVALVSITSAILYGRRKPNFSFYCFLNFLANKPQIQTDFPPANGNLPVKLGIMAGRPRIIKNNNGRIEKIDPSIIMFQNSKRKRTLNLAYACHIELQT